MHEDKVKQTPIIHIYLHNLFLYIQYNLHIRIAIKFINGIEVNKISLLKIKRHAEFNT